LFYILCEFHTHTTPQYVLQFKNGMLD